MNSDHLMKNYLMKRQVFRSGQKLNHYIDPSRKVCSKTLKIKKCGCLKAEFKAERAEMSVLFLQSIFEHTPYCARWTSLDKLQSWIRLARSELDLDKGRSCKAFLMFSTLLLALLILTFTKIN